MVSTTESKEAVVNGSTSEPAEGVPHGQYRLVAWDVDITGRRLIDEICQIAAYTPNSDFAQYIMPFSDLNLVARRRHNIRVVTVGFFRMLKDSKTNKVLKTKSEVSALTDFLSWLEEVKGDAADGVILMYHEARKAVTFMLLESLSRYNLMDRFATVVKGFVNSFTIAEDKCAKTMKSFSLKMLSRVLLDKSPELDNAAERAKLTYEVIQYLSQSERQDLLPEGSGDGNTGKNMVDLVRSYTCPLQSEINELDSLKRLLKCQNTFRPIFGSFLRSNHHVRQHASHLRRLIAENNIDYSVFESAWKVNNREGLLDVLKSRVKNANERENEEILEILDCHFDPEKKSTQQKRNPRVQKKSLSNSASLNDATNTSSNNIDTPDTTSKGDLSLETTPNVSSDGSQTSSANTPRSQAGEATPAK